MEVLEDHPDSLAAEPAPLGVVQVVDAPSREADLIRGHLPGGSSDPITALPILDLPARSSSQVKFDAPFLSCRRCKERKRIGTALPTGQKEVHRLLFLDHERTRSTRRTSVRTGFDGNQPRRRPRWDVRHFMTLRKAVGSGWYADRSHPDGARPGTGIGRQTRPPLRELRRGTSRAKIVLVRSSAIPVNRYDCEVLPDSAQEAAPS